MSGISVKLPLGVSSADGAYTLHKDLLGVIKQNFKMLILTIPGERIMNPDFGVGIQKYLFENDTMELRSRISTRIKDQVARYMPFLKVKDVILPQITDQRLEGNNFLNIQIKYLVESISTRDVLNISLPNYDPGDNVY